MKHFFVVNPYALRTQERLDQILAEIENCFSAERRDDYKIHLSRYPRNAIAAVHRYISNCPENEIVRIYAVGGDGILFDCLNGMVDFPNAELTNVPYGNDDDFVRVFGDNVKERFRNIKELTVSPARPIDIINCGSNYTLIETQIGFVGQTVIISKDLFRRFPEKLLRKNITTAYMLCAIKSMLNDAIMRQKYTILLDGEDLSGNYCNIQVSNIACTAGTTVPIPYAMPDSGFLEVIFFKTSRKRDIIKAMDDYNKGHFEKHDFFVHRRCRTIQIKSGSIMSVEMDGEGYYTRELNLEIVPKGIKFFAPKDMDFADYSSRAYKSSAKDEKK